MINVAFVLLLLSLIDEFILSTSGIGHRWKPSVLIDTLTTTSLIYWHTFCHFGWMEADKL